MARDIGRRLDANDRGPYVSGSKFGEMGSIKKVREHPGNGCKEKAESVSDSGKNK